MGSLIGFPIIPLPLDRAKKHCINRPAENPVFINSCLSSRRLILYVAITAMHYISFFNTFAIIFISLPTILSIIITSIPEYYMFSATSAIYPRLKAERSFRFSRRDDCCDIGCVPDCPGGTICVENDNCDTGCCPEGDFLCNGEFICCPQGTSCQGNECVG